MEREKLLSLPFLHLINDRQAEAYKENTAGTRR